MYVGGKKPGPCAKVWRGKVVQVLHGKAGVATDEAKIVMLLILMEE